MGLSKERQILRKSLEKGLVFFTGAGISASYPSALPLGYQISNLATTLLVDSANITEQELKNNVSQYISNIPMELLWESITRAVGPKALNALQVLKRGSPNKDHIMIALACDVYPGKVIFTLNFDLLHEKAVRKFTELSVERVSGNTSETNINPFEKTTEISVIHLHGALSLHESYSKLAATVSNIGTGLPKNKANLLNAAINKWDVLCAGYSDQDSDTFPILENIPNRLFWYSYDGVLPKNVEVARRKLGDRFILLNRNKYEEGFWQLLNSASPLLEKEFKKITNKEKWIKKSWGDKQRSLMRYRLSNMERILLDQLGRDKNQREYVSRLILSILSDELGKREDSIKLLSLPRNKFSPTHELIYTEYMLRGHNLERKGDVRTASQMFKKAILHAPDELKLQHAQVELASARIGIWKRQPFLLGYIVSWYILISRYKQLNPMLRSRMEWEIGDLAHFVGEYLLFPSSILLYLNRGNISKTLLKPIGIADKFILLFFNSFRKRLLQVAAKYYSSAARFALRQSNDPLPGYTSLALIRFAECLAALGKVAPANYALKLATRADQFYSWVKSEHGKANSTCAQGIVAFYSGRINESRILLSRAKKEYGSHLSGIGKATLFELRLTTWALNRKH